MRRQFQRSRLVLLPQAFSQGMGVRTATRLYSSLDRPPANSSSGKSSSSTRLIFGIEPDATTLLWGCALLALGVGSIYATYHNSQKDERREQRRLERKEARERIMRATMDRFGIKSTANDDDRPASPTAVARKEIPREEEKVSRIEQQTSPVQEEESRWKKMAGGVKGKLHSLAASKRPNESEQSERK